MRAKSVSIMFSESTLIKKPLSTHCIHQQKCSSIAKQHFHIKVSKVTYISLTAVVEENYGLKYFKSLCIGVQTMSDSGTSGHCCL